MRVTARGPEGVPIAFSRAREPSRAPMAAYLTQVWAEGVALDEVERLTVNGMAAATGRAQGRAQGGRLNGLHRDQSFPTGYRLKIGTE